MADVLEMIDEALGVTVFREQYSSNEVADLLLDLRGAAVRELVSA